MRAAGLCSAVAILIAGSGIGLAVGSAHAETAALAEREAPDSADSGVGETTPTARRAQKAEQRRERREFRIQRREELLAHARALLFDGIQLSAEQARGVDAIIETQLEEGKRSWALRAELAAAQEQGDTERIRAIRRERRELRERLKGPDKCMEELRALLSEEQRPTFDMNRARLAAEGQGQEPQKRRRQRRPRAGAAVEAE